MQRHCADNGICGVIRELPEIGDIALLELHVAQPKFCNVRVAVFNHGRREVDTDKLRIRVERRDPGELVAGPQPRSSARAARWMTAVAWAL